MTEGCFTYQYCQVTFNWHSECEHVSSIDYRYNEEGSLPDDETWVLKDDGEITITLNPRYTITDTDPANGELSGSGTSFTLKKVTDHVNLTIAESTEPEPPTPPSPSNPGSNPASGNPSAGNNSSKENTEAKTEDPAPSAFELYLQQQATLIKNAKAGETITIKSDVWNSYPLWFMKLMEERRNINIIMEYNYKGVHYTVGIPVKTTVTLDEKTPWYGPLKLANLFGAQTK